MHLVHKQLLYWSICRLTMTSGRKQSGAGGEGLRRGFAIHADAFLCLGLLLLLLPIVCLMCGCSSAMTKVFVSFSRAHCHVSAMSICCHCQQSHCLRRKAYHSLRYVCNSHCRRCGAIPVAGATLNHLI